MSYEEIFEKIRKAKALAESKKTKSDVEWEDKPQKDTIPKSKNTISSNHEYREVVEDWSQPEDLAPDGKTFLDLFTSRWKCYSKWPNNVKELDNLYRHIDIHNNIDLKIASSILRS